jgi:hypothetical protein
MANRARTRGPLQIPQVILVDIEQPLHRWRRRLQRFGRRDRFPILALWVGSHC